MLLIAISVRESSTGGEQATYIVLAIRVEPARVNADVTQTEARCEDREPILLGAQRVLQR